ncbi:MAG: DUF748 domain-containing protein [Planctomycetota bacterium]
MTLAFARADLDVSALLFGRVSVHALAVDGLRATLVRGADGRWQWPKQPAAAPNPAVPAAPVPEPAPAAPGPVDLSSPVAIASAHLGGVRVSLRDEFVQPAIVTEVALAATVQDVGHDSRPARLEVDLSASDLVDALRLRARARSGVRTLDLAADLDLLGLRRAAAPYLAELGLEPHAERGDAEVSIRAELAPRVDDPVGASGTLEARAKVVADGREEAAVDAVRVPIEHVDTATLRLGEAVVQGVRLAAGRSSAGALRLPLFDLTGAASSPADAAPKAVEAASSAPTSAGSSVGETSSAAGMAVAVRTLRLQELTLAWDDEAMVPAAQPTLRVPELRVENLAWGRGTGQTPVRLAATLVADDAVRTLAVDGTWMPDTGRAQAKVRAEGVTLAAVRPYLAAAGLAPDLRDGELRFDLEATVTPATDGLDVPSIALVGLALVDGEREWAAVDRVQVGGLRQHGTATTVERVELAGTRAYVERDAGGALTWLGLRQVGSVEASAPTPPSPPSRAAAPGTAASFSLAALSWQGGPFTFADAAPPGPGAEPTEPTVLRIDRVGAELEGLSLSEGPPELRHLQLEASAAALADAVVLTASCTPEGEVAQLQVDLRGDGLRPNSLQPYLARVGLEPRFAAATMRAQVTGRLVAVPDGLTMSGEVRDVEWVADGTSWFRLPGLRVQPSTFAAGVTRIGAVEVEAPRLALERTASGDLVALGFRLRAPSPAPVAAAAPTPANRPEAKPLPAAEPMAIGPLRLRGAEVQWRDDALTPATSATLQLDASLEGLGRAGEPATFTVQAAVEPWAGSLAVDGSFAQDGEAVSVQMNLRGQTQHLERAQAYLPPTVQVGEGTRALDVAARLSLGPAPEGGQRLEVSVPELRVGDGSGATSVGLRDLSLRARRLDPAGRVFDIDALAVQGVEAELEQTPAGIRIAGITLVSPPPEGPAPPPRPVTPAQAGEAPRRAGAPTVTVGGVDLQVERLRWRDATRAGAQPIDLSLRLQHPEPFTLLAADADDLPPVALHADLGVEPLADGIAVDLTYAPAVREPRVEVQVAARGVRPAGLAAALPGLADRIDPASSTLASLGAKLGVTLRLPTGGLSAFDPNDGFGAEVELTEVAARDAEGSVLAGVDAVRVDVQRILPASGGVHVKAIEVEQLRGQVQRTAEGTRVVGLILRPAPPADGASAPPENPEPRPEPAAAPAAAPATPSPGGDIRIDTVAVSGIDFAFVDATTTPPVAVPLVGLDVEVKGFTTRALREPVPITFQASVQGGKVELRERDKSSSVLSGVLGAMARAVAGEGDDFVTEERPVFDEIALSGRLSLGPQLQGWTRLDVGALELPALAGLASGAGVTIGDGVLDSSVRVRFDPGGAAGVQSQVNFSNLSVSEPAGGPISTYLKLPAPLDAVLFALKNADDEHRLPLSFRLDAGGLSAGSLALSATTALGKLIASALAAAPLRATSTLTGLVGLGGGEAEPVEPARVEFAAGDVELPPTAAQAIDQAKAQLAVVDSGAVVLEHELGSDDVPRAAAFANPADGDALALGAGLRRRLDRLRREHDLLAAQARAQVLTGEESASTVERLRALDVEIKTTDTALGNVLDLLRPGADRRAEARTRAACRALGETRLAAVRAALLAAWGEEFAARIEVRRPKAECASPPSAQGQVRLRIRTRAAGD